MMILTLRNLFESLLVLSLLSLSTLPNETELLRANHPDIALSDLGFEPKPFKHNLSLPNGPDVTVVLLNWSRLPNVILITTLMCSHELDDVVSKISIWNNNPSYIISLNTLQATRCPASKIQIVNSKENLYFAARFHACASSLTTYCFIQDDDYLIPPSALWALRLSIPADQDARDIHMLPAIELLSSRLREISSPDGRLHTFPAWLGYGTLIPKQRASCFLETFLSLENDPHSIQMADNYYSVLSNRKPDLWFGQETGLGLGQPFTIGVLGENRNWKYIEAAKSLLERSLDSPVIPGTFINSNTNDPSKVVWRAPCRGQLCLIETNIKLFPELSQPQPTLTLRELDSFRRNQLDSIVKAHFESFPLSFAVDSDTLTAFCSLQGSEASDYIKLDMFRVVSAPLNVALDNRSDEVFENAIKQFSNDDLHWMTAICLKHEDQWRCKSSEGDWRHFRLTFKTPTKKPWCIRELYTVM